jgi:hypothetical protein
MPSPLENFHYVRADEFFMNAQPTTIAQDVREAIHRQKEVAPYDERRRRDEDWSLMANRVVGSEGD